MKYTVQEIDELREATIALQKHRLRMRRSELNMAHIEEMVRTYMYVGVRAEDVLALKDAKLGTTSSRIFPVPNTDGSPFNG
jgi:hypothetical protein